MSSTPPLEPFVLVPVPIEHQQEFVELVMRISLRDAAMRWDRATVEQLLASLDDDHRALLRFLCSASQTGAGTTSAAAGEALGHDPDTVLVMVKALNDAGVALNKPVLVLVNDRVTPVGLGVSPGITTLVFDIEGSDDDQA